MSIQGNGGSVFGEMSVDRNPFQEPSLEGEIAISGSSFGKDSIDQSPDLPKVSEIDVASLPAGTELKAIDEKTGKPVILLKKAEGVLEQQIISPKAQEIDKILEDKEKYFAEKKENFVNKVNSGNIETTPLEINKLKTEINNVVINVADIILNEREEINPEDIQAKKSLSRFEKFLETARKFSDKAIPLQEIQQPANGVEPIPNGNEPLIDVVTIEDTSLSNANNAENPNKEPDSFDAITNPDDYKNYLQQLIEYFEKQDGAFSKIMSGWEDKKKAYQNLKRVENEIEKLTNEKNRIQKEIDDRQLIGTDSGTTFDFSAKNLDLNQKTQQIAVLQEQLVQSQSDYDKKFSVDLDENNIYYFAKTTKEIFAGIDRTKDKFSDDSQILEKLTILNGYKEKIAGLEKDVTAFVNENINNKAGEVIEDLENNPDLLNQITKGLSDAEKKDRLTRYFNKALDVAGFTAETVSNFVKSGYENSSFQKFMDNFIRPNSGESAYGSHYKSGENKEKREIVGLEQFKERFQDPKRALFALKKSIKGLEFKNFYDEKNEEITKLLDTENPDIKKVQSIFIDMYQKHLGKDAEKTEENNNKFSKIFTTALLSNDDDINFVASDYAMQWFGQLMENEGKALKELWKNKEEDTKK